MGSTTSQGVCLGFLWQDLALLEGNRAGIRRARESFLILGVLSQPGAMLLPRQPLEPGEVISTGGDCIGKRPLEIVLCD